MREVRWLGTKARELLDAYDREPPVRRLRTFAEVETLWDEVIRPALPNIRTLKQVWGDRESVPADSVWFPNSRVPDTF